MPKRPYMPITNEQLIAMVDRIPAFPQSVHRILALTASADCSPKDLVAVIERDPILTIKVLKLVNSAFFGLSKEIDSVNRAVIYVGFNTIKNVAISVASAGALPRTNKAGLKMNDFWNHSLAVGVIAKLLAANRDIQGSEVSSFFVAGLLHDIGKILFAYYFPQQYKEALSVSLQNDTPLYLAERELLSVDHCQVGALLAKEWCLPQELFSGMEKHHQTSFSPEDDAISKAIYAADQISHYIQEPQHTLRELPEEVEIWLGGPIQKAVESLPDFFDEMNKAALFIDYK